MADYGLFIGWGRVIPGREELALKLFGEVTQYYQGLQQRGTIESFEPRLRRIRVTNPTEVGSTQQAIVFHVDALLMMDPAPERIAFDTVLEVSKGAYTVKET